MQNEILPSTKQKIPDIGLGNRPVRVLELGSGTGILGLCVASLGDVQVLLTDPALNVNLSETESSNTINQLQANLERNREVVGQRYSFANLRKFDTFLITFCYISVKYFRDYF